MTDGIVRCTSMQRPRRTAWQRNCWRTVKGVICLRHFGEGHIVAAPSGVLPDTPNPRSPEGFRNPAQPAPEPMPWAGFSMALRRAVSPDTCVLALGRCEGFDVARLCHFVRKLCPALAEQQVCDVAVPDPANSLWRDRDMLEPAGD